MMLKQAEIRDEGNWILDFIYESKGNYIFPCVEVFDGEKTTIYHFKKIENNVSVYEKLKPSMENAHYWRLMSRSFLVLKVYKPNG